jgi:hypothetical protein
VHLQEILGGDDCAYIYIIYTYINNINIHYVRVCVVHVYICTLISFFFQLVVGYTRTSLVALVAWCVCVQLKLYH